MERALQEIVQRAVEGALTPLRQELRSGVPMVSGGGAARGASAVFDVHQAVSRILQPTGQGEILAALLQGAKKFGGRCALFARRGESFSYWRGEGFPPATVNRLRSVTVVAAQSGIFKEVCENQFAVATTRSAENLTPALDQALGGTAGESIYLFPIAVQGKVVAALYSDAGEQGGSLETSALDILAKVAGLSLETSASRAARSSTAQPVISETAPSAEASRVAETPAEAAVEEIQEVDSAAAPFGSFAASVPAPPVAEAVTPPPDVDSLPETERDIHRRAHRFARVAVQDLLSYHKDKIEEGRRNKNLYDVLREDIEKTRENYQKRFGQTAAASFDYFHYELVVKLAGNDLETLGNQYPGPVGN
ncbi:MAG: hypothetical protein HY313_10150 [Acidobacteria bacterium]|nr:hypothetical protein [Acidobacteriota bacterium]